MYEWNTCLTRGGCTLIGGEEPGKAYRLNTVDWFTPGACHAPSTALYLATGFRAAYADL